MQAAKDFVYRWISGINTANVDQLTAMYDDSALLIPTFSNRILNTPAKIRDYFERLSAKQDISISLHENLLYQQCVQDEIVALHGIYTWRFSVDDEPLSFEARFSYLVDLKREKPIINHHSSQVPRVL